NTTSVYPASAREAIGQRIAAIESHGLGAVSMHTMTRFFSAQFRQDQAATVARHQRLLESTDPEGYIACAAAVCEVNTSARLNQIRIPTLVIASEYDEGTPLDMALALARAIARAQLVTLAGCAHLSPVEQPRAFSDVVGEFVASL
ncbi:MAG: alpha/beta hydrolase, partial [Pseudomonadota bacterium]